MTDHPGRRRDRGRPSVPSLLWTIALAALVLTAGAVAASGSGLHPRLAVVRTSPTAVISGRQFRSHARVLVTVRSDVKRSRTVTANSSGDFTARFTTPIDRCSAWSVTAVQGSQRVVLRGPAKPECAPIQTP